MEQTATGADESLGEVQDRHDSETLSRYGRRALMLGAGAAGAGLAATLAGHADPAAAANNSPVELGKSNSASASTVITTSGGNGLNGVTTSDETYACGVLGESKYGIGVYGTQSSKSGLLGVDGNPASAAVVGDSGAGVGVLGLSSSTNGITGVTTADTWSGVYGVDNSPEGGAALSGLSTAGYGVYAQTTSGVGVGASSAESTGVLGIAIGPSRMAVEAGVAGDSESLYGVAGTSSGSDGVYGETTSTGSSGVAGVDMSTGSGAGYGVSGQSTAGTGVSGASGTGIGVYAASSGTALQVDGVATFSRSGEAKVAGTSTETAISVKVKDVPLTSSSLILAIAQTYVAGVGVAAVVPDVNGSSFIIYLTEGVEVSVKVAWFVVG